MSGTKTALVITRRTAAEITTLARQSVLGEKWVVNDERAVECAFSIPRMFGFGSIANIDDLGALIGTLSESTGASLNGYPMFTSVGFLHKDDVGPFCSEVDRMEEALGFPASTKSESPGGD